MHKSLDKRLPKDGLNLGGGGGGGEGKDGARRVTIIARQRAFISE